MGDAAKHSTGQLNEYGQVQREHRSPGEIVRDIVANAQDIIRAEVKLAKTEIREESQKAISASAMLVAGGVIALYGLGFLLAAITAALALVMPFWAAALIVGALLAAGGGAGIALGLQHWKKVHAPRKTIEDVKENVEWLKHQTKS